MLFVKKEEIIIILEMWYIRNSADDVACSNDIRGRRDRKQKERNQDREKKKEEGDEKGRYMGWRMVEKEMRRREEEKYRRVEKERGRETESML